MAQDIPVNPVTLGDLNGDGSVNALDLAMLKKYLLGNISDFPVEDDLGAADVNGDQNIDALDYAVVKSYILQIISEFPKK
jgi:hypothetical protein